MRFYSALVNRLGMLQKDKSKPKETIFPKENILIDVLVGGATTTCPHPIDPSDAEDDLLIQ